ncbi:hypothetical protein QQG55_13475 [Brugia pahangi]
MQKLRIIEDLTLYLLKYMAVSSIVFGREFSSEMQTFWIRYVFVRVIIFDFENWVENSCKYNRGKNPTALWNLL